MGGFAQVKEMEERLEKVRGGVALVNPEEREAVSRTFAEKVSQWRKRKRMFKDLWDAITENSPKDLKQFKVWLVGEYNPRVIFLLDFLFFFYFWLDFNRKSLDSSTMKTSM